VIYSLSIKYYIAGAIATEYRIMSFNYLLLKNAGRQSEGNERVRNEGKHNK
jgi:hypothetical protein